MTTTRLCQNTLKLIAVQPRTYGSDPYNTHDALTINKHIIRTYRGPLTAIAYRDQRYWDFAAGVSSAQKLATYQLRL